MAPGSVGASAGPRPWCEQPGGLHGHSHVLRNYPGRSCRKGKVGVREPETSLEMDGFYLGGNTSLECFAIFFFQISQIVWKKYDRFLSASRSEPGGHLPS